MSAPPSSIKVAHVCRNRWHEPVLPSSACRTYRVTRSDSPSHPSRSPSKVRNSTPASGGTTSCGRTSAQVPTDPHDRPLAERHHPVLVPLALPHLQRPPLRIDVEERQLGRLPPSDPRRVQRLEDRPVTHPQRIEEVRLRQHPLRLRRRQDVLRKTRLSGAAARDHSPDSTKAHSYAPAT